MPEHRPSTGLIAGVVGFRSTIPLAAFSPTVTLTDDHGGTDSRSLTWVVANPSFAWSMSPVASPVIAGLSAQSSAEGATVSLAVSATDPASYGLTYAAIDLPVGLSINASTGLISGTVDYAAAEDFAGSYSPVVIVADGHGGAATQAFIWGVSDTPRAPSLTSIGAQGGTSGDSVSLQVAASDADGNPLYYDASGLPFGLSIDPDTGLVSGTVADDAVSGAAYGVTVTADDGVGETTRLTFLWAVNPSPITAQAATIAAVTDTDTGWITVGTFTTPEANSQAADFTATLAWGDGTTDDAFVTGENGSFTVTADHSYAQAGSFSVVLTVTNANTGATVSASGTASVTAVPWALTGGLQQGVIVAQPNNLVLGTLQDGDANVGAGDFSVSIDPGDGGSAVTGQVTALGSGLWSISLPYSYSQSGTYTATLTVTGPSGAPRTATSTVVAGDLYAGVPSNLTVAQFAVADPMAQASDYTATITWGDGTSSAGTVSGSSGLFTVQGGHAYGVDSHDEPAGAYQVSVAVSKAGQAVLSASHSVVVARPPMTLSGANVVSDGTILTDATVAVFTEPDALDGEGEFTATVAWGDGSTGAGTVHALAPGLFAVVGSHSYATGGYFATEVDVSQAWGTQELTRVAVGTVLMGVSGLFVAPHGIVAAPVRIQDMKFTGGYDLKSDAGVSFGPVQWIGKGVNAPVSSPYAYKKKTGRLAVTANFTLADPLVLNEKVAIQATVTGRATATGPGFKTTLPMEWVTPKKNKTYQYSERAADSFPDALAAYGPLTITWKASLTGEANTFGIAGRTKNTVYLLYGAPMAPLLYNKAKKALPAQLYETVVAYGSAGPAAGKINPTPADVLANVWSHFKDKTATRASDGEPLTYYGVWATPGVAGASPSLAGLLKTGDGACTAFSDLMLQAIRVQGLPTPKIADEPNAIGNARLNMIAPVRKAGESPEGIMVAPWTFGAENNVDANKGKYPWVNPVNTILKIGAWTFPGVRPQLKIGDWEVTGVGVQQYDWNGVPAVSYRGARVLLLAQNNDNLAQNNANPLATFTNHVFVYVNGKYYDPSYGVIYNTKNDVLTKAILGYYDMDALRSKNKMYIRKPDGGDAAVIAYEYGLTPG